MEPVVRTGAVVLATVRTRATRDVVLQGGEATLTCATSYRYTTGGIFGTSYASTARRREDLATQLLAGPTLLRAGQRTEDQVLLAVPPDGPPSVACDLVTIAWQARAFARYEGSGRAGADAVPVTVLGAGTGADTGGGTVVDRGRFGSIAVEGLATRRVVPGASLAGRVAVRARRPDLVEGLWAALVLTQVVPHGPMLGDDPSRNPYLAEKEAEAVAVRESLGSPAEAGDGRLVAPFRLEVPRSLRAPTLVTSEFSLRWVLRVGVVRRVAGVRRTTTADVEVDVATWPPG